MGGSESKVQQLTEIINKTALEATMSVGSKMSNVGVQLQNFIIEDVEGISVRDIQMAQKLSIDASTLTNGNVNANLQSSLLTNIMNEVNKVKNGFPEITASKSDTDIKNIIKNEISAKFSVQAMSEMSNSLQQTQTFKIARSKGVDVSKVRMTQEAKGVYKQINTLATDIASKLTGEATVVNKTTEKQENPISSIIDSTGGLIGKIGDIFGLDTSTVMIGGIVLIVAIIAGVFMMGSGDSDKFAKMMADTRRAQMGAPRPSMAPGYPQQPMMGYPQQPMMGYPQPMMGYPQMSATYLPPPGGR
jgi:hypothetical protein